MPISNATTTIVDSTGTSTVISVATIPASGVIVMGSDGTNTRFISTDTSGRTVVVGAGVAGTPAGGVISIQGVSGGQAIPISGTVTATNPSVSTTGSTVPASATFIGGSDGTNLVALRIKAASTAAVAADPSLVVALSPNSPIPTGANVIGAVTQSGTWSVTATQATAANLNATIVGLGTSGTPSGGVLSIQNPDTTATAALGALNAASSISLSGSSGVGFQLAAGTLIGTLVAELSFDGGTTWIATLFDDPATGNKTATIVFASSNTATARSIIGAHGASNARVRVSAFTSGTASCAMRASTLADPSTLFGGAAGAALPPVVAQVGGTDGSLLRSFLTDSTGRQVLVGAGTAGTATGGVVTIQGIAGGTAIPVSGSITATNPSVSTTGSAVPASATFIGGSDGTNLVALRIKAASTAAIATDPSLVVALSPNSPIPTGANVIGAVTQSGAWSVTATQATAANLNALVAQGAAGTAAAAWFVKTTDGTNTVAVKAASTVPVAADPALVVALSPNRYVDPASTGTLGALNAAVTISTAGNYTVGGIITGTWVGTITAEGTIDGTNWITVRTANKSTNDIFSTYTANDSFEFYSVAGCTQLRVRMSAYTSGTATITLAGTQVATDAMLNYSGTDGDVSPPTRHLSFGLQDSSGVMRLPKVANTTPTGTEYAILTRGVGTQALGGQGASSFVPDPTSIISTTSTAIFDVVGNLQTRGAVFTDEESFRDDFPGSSLTSAVTGTVTVVSGSTAVTGTGTLFTTELNNQKYIRLSAHANSALTRVDTVVSDTQLTLATGYLGASGSTAAIQANWDIRTDGTTSITVGSSLVNLVCSTTNGNVVEIARTGDYLPFVLTVQATISQRIANQQGYIGFADTTPTPNKQCTVIFDGTDNTKVRFRTAFSSAAADIQETLATIPTGTSATSHSYEINLGPNLAALAIDGTIVASHATHLPGPYDSLSIAAGIVNTGTAASATTLSVDALFFQNLDTVNVGNIFRAEPFGVQLLGKVASTGLLQGVNTDGNGNLNVITSTVPTTSAPGIAFGDPTLASATLAAIRRTTYTEQTSNFTGSIRSSSANDTAAGTGARTVTITWIDSTGVSTGTEVVTLNGTTAVNLVTTTKSFIEKMVVTTVGSGGVAAGTISLFTGAGATGTTVGTIAAGDNQTYWGHHYVLSGKTCNVTGTLIGSTSTVAGNGAVFVIKSLSIGVANTPERQVSDFLTLYGQSSHVPRNYGSYIQVAGPARVLMYVTPVAGASVTFRGSFDYYDI